MKKRTFISLLILLFWMTKIMAQIDTLNAVFEFDAPSENAWGITYDGTNLWVSDVENGTIYKTSTDGVVLDSMTISGAMIKGIEIVNDTLWAINSNIVGDSAFSLYQMDMANGTIHDSIIIICPCTNGFSGMMWGLCYNQSCFYVSFDGGYGSCLIKINPVNHTQQSLCCTHLSGLASISDSVWAIRNGFYIKTTDGQQEFPKYRTNIYASDLTYDGSSFWVVNMNSDKIHRLESVVLSNDDKMCILQGIVITPNPTDGDIKIELGQAYVEKIELSDIRGQIVKTTILNEEISNYLFHVSDVESGVYLLRIFSTGNQFTRKVIIR